MLTPGKLYIYGMNIPLTFFTLTKCKFGYKRTTQRIIVDKNTPHLFIGRHPIVFGGLRKDSFKGIIFMVHDKIIGRSLWDESYMIQVL